uniref:SCP domain-containing protein n=1 Tax=Heterorhabditis bacteriophora TaxID=37862 RepID=A0A1I7XSZ7_HETBA
MSCGVSAASGASVSPRGFTDLEIEHIVNAGLQLDKQYGHLFDARIINGSLEDTMSRIIKLLNALESKPTWAPLSWATKTGANLAVSKICDSHYCSKMEVGCSICPQATKLNITVKAKFNIIYVCRNYVAGKDCLRTNNAVVMRSQRYTLQLSDRARFDPYTCCYRS